MILERFRERAEMYDWLSTQQLTIYGAVQSHVGHFVMTAKEAMGYGYGRFDEYGEQIGPRTDHEAGRIPLIAGIGLTAVGVGCGIAQLNGLV